MQWMQGKARQCLAKLSTTDAVCRSSRSLKKDPVSEIPLSRAHAASALKMDVEMGCYAERYAAMRRSRSVCDNLSAIFLVPRKTPVGRVAGAWRKKAGSIKTVDELGGQVSVSCRIIPSDDRGGSDRG